MQLVGNPFLESGEVHEYETKKSVDLESGDTCKICTDLTTLQKDDHPLATGELIETGGYENICI